MPSHFDPNRVGEVWRVDYAARAREASAWSRAHGIAPAEDDGVRTCLLLIDCQNTFCTPGHELFVAGRSGTGAVEDSVRLCRFIYRNLPRLTEVCATLDTHTAVQIFHPVFWLDAEDEHPVGAATVITAEDLERGRWRVNPAVAHVVAGGDEQGLAEHALHYVRALEQGRYALTVWPYHAMLGSVGHALVSAVEEALFFHGVARRTAPRFEIKGDHPLTESYSVIRPEVTVCAQGGSLGFVNDALVDHLAGFDAVLVAGQAKSHCVAWSARDLLELFEQRGAGLAERLYLLEDCTSAVVVPGVVDFTEQAEETFNDLGSRGMRIVRSTDPVEEWGGPISVAQG